jgi:hypothetical protein
MKNMREDYKYGRVYSGRNGYDLLGKRFGAIITETYTTYRGRRVWRCLCDCGKYTLVETRNLVRYPDRKCEHISTAIEESEKDKVELEKAIDRVRHHLGNGVQILALIKDQTPEMRECIRLVKKGMEEL